QGWENLFPPGSCDGDSAACSAGHDFIRLLFQLLGKHSFDCGLDAGCSDSCGPHPLGKYDACAAAAEAIRAAYRARIQPRCPPPRPNEIIQPECTFPGCFGDGIPTGNQACWFVQCAPDSALSSSLACDCCNQCPPPAPQGGGGEVSCRDDQECN